MSRLLDFYRGDAPDTQSRFLKDILAWDDGELEAVHDFIQWLFPLPEPSNFNRNTPLLTEQDMAAFQTDPVLQANLQKSFNRILSFLGLVTNEVGSVVAGPNFTARKHDVWASPNHNWLRISRILRSLALLGCERQAQALYAWLMTQYQSKKFFIGAETFGFWTNAVESARSSS